MALIKKFFYFVFHIIWYFILSLNILSALDRMSVQYSSVLVCVILAFLCCFLWRCVLKSWAVCAAPLEEWWAHFSCSFNLKDVLLPRVSLHKCASGAATQLLWNLQTTTLSIFSLKGRQFPFSSLNFQVVLIKWMPECTINLEEQLRAEENKYALICSTR